VAEIARLDDRFAVLRGGARDAPQRHRTLHAVIDWSWNLLDPAGQAAMRALSVFPGGFTADAARHLLGADVLLVLEQLADQSLLKVADTASGARYRMLETVREFAAARREDAAETEAVISRFLAWARDFGAVHHDFVLTGDDLPAFELIRVEQDNLVLALRHGLDRKEAERSPRCRPCWAACGWPNRTSPGRTPWPRTRQGSWRGTGRNPPWSRPPGPAWCSA
jgi:predicted ATPase